MEPAGQLPLQGWLVAEETRKLVDALGNDGQEVRFVGGCVRDSLLKRDVKDIDLAIPDPPEIVMAKLDKAGIKAVPTGLSHGTITAIPGERIFQITTLRRDIETDGRHAKVSFINDWLADSQRRDFTINALYASPDGAVFDYCGGINDLASGCIRFIGLPKQRIDEDALRIMRFFRFFAFYGTPPYDPASLMACRLSAHLLGNLSKERMAAELLKIMMAPDPGSVLIQMQAQQILSLILPEAKWFERLRILTFLENRGLVRPGIVPEPLRRLSCLCEFASDHVFDLARRLRLSRQAESRLRAIKDNELDPSVEYSHSQSRQLLYRLGPLVFRDIVLLAWVKRRAVENCNQAKESQKWIAMLDLADNWQQPFFPLSGQDLLDRGYAPDILIGQKLAELKKYWQENDFVPDREELLQLTGFRLAKNNDQPQSGVDRLVTTT